MELVLALVGLVVLDLLALEFGFDSREKWREEAVARIKVRTDWWRS